MALLHLPLPSEIFSSPKSQMDLFIKSMSTLSQPCLKSVSLPNIFKDNFNVLNEAFHPCFPLGLVPQCSLPHLSCSRHSEFFSLLKNAPSSYQLQDMRSHTVSYNWNSHFFFPSHFMPLSNQETI